MTELSDEARRHYEELAQSFDDHVSRFRDEAARRMSEGEEGGLAAELDRIEGYLELHDTGEVDDLEIQVRFLHAKAAVLREILDSRRRSG